MRTIIAGGRFITDVALVEKAIRECGWEPTVILSGAARGVDSIAENWATRNGIPLELYPADWNTYNRAAGPKRNKEMAQKAEALIAVWDGTSRGTKNMIDTARKLGLRVFVSRIGATP